MVQRRLAYERRKSRELKQCAKVLSGLWDWAKQHNVELSSRQLAALFVAGRKFMNARDELENISSLPDSAWGDLTRSVNRSILELVDAIALASHLLHRESDELEQVQ